MNYKLTCQTCDKEVKVSTHDDATTEFHDHKTGIIEISFDCPECDAEILVVK